MVSDKTVRELALRFEQTDEKKHFDRIAFRVKGKIFATLSVGKKEVTLKLSINEQSVWSLAKPAVIYPVPGAWGKKGWTIIQLKETTKGFFSEVLTMAYCQVAPAAIASKYRLYRNYAAIAAEALPLAVNYILINFIS